MKKLVFLVVLCAALTMTTSAFASLEFDEAGNSSATGVMADYKTSKNVTLVCASAAASYAAVSSHLNGTKVFGSSSGDSVIYTKNGGKTAGEDYTTAPTASDSSEFTSGWSSL
nr:hypothetical protein [uncultured Desulfuromonas sp.]